MPMDELHRSLPTSPFDMGARDPRVMSTGYDTGRMSMDGPDYFGAMGMGPFNSGPHSRGPFPPGFDSEMMGDNQQSVDDLVRRSEA